MSQRFIRTTPFADMLPAASDFLYHPIDATGMLIEVIRLTELHNSAIVAEKRKRLVDDVGKRAKFRRAHGLSEEQGIAGMLGLGNRKEEGEGETPAGGEVVVGMSTAESSPAAPEPRKKILGIF